MKGARQLLPLVAALLQACASTPDPTNRTEVRWRVGRLLEDRFLADGGVGGHACLLDTASERCRAWREFRSELLRRSAQAPEDPYVVGQVVYALVRSGAYEEARATLSPCRTAAWWCRVLEGHVLAESGRVGEAEAVFDEALGLMPEEERCEWADVSLLVSGTVRKAYGGSSCRERLEREERFWWLVDPAWVVPGNDRRLEHYNRMAWAALHDDALTGEAGEGRVNDGSGHSRGHHRTVVRYGMDFVRDDARWTPGSSHQAFRVVPRDDALLTPFHASMADWPVEPDGTAEHYVPTWGAFTPLDAQVAFFERGDSLVAAAAAAVPEERPFREAADPEAVLFLHAGPPSEPVTARATAREGRWVFRGAAPRRRYVVGVEALATGGFARVRLGHGLPHEPPQPLRLSDVLLYTPDEGPPPDSLEEAVPLMKGGHRWRRGETIGVYLEVHAPTDPRSVPVSIELERKRGWLARLGGLLGLGGGEPVEMTWSQPGTEGRFPVAFTLDLRDVSEGEHTLRVSVEAPGLSPATVEKEIRIVDGGTDP